MVPKYSRSSIVKQQRYCPTPLGKAADVPLVPKARTLGRTHRHTRLGPRAGLTRTFQIMQDFPKLTLLHNVMIGAYAHHRSVASARRRALAVLERFGMIDRREELAQNLTLADLKRHEIAKALATDPALILLDEVVAGLTPTEIDDMVGLIRGIRAEGVTILMIEHVMQAVMALSDVIVVLDHGEKIFEGSPDAAKRDPRVVEAYLGEGAAHA